MTKGNSDDLMPVGIIPEVLLMRYIFILFILLTTNSTLAAQEESLFFSSNPKSIVSKIPTLIGKKYRPTVWESKLHIPLIGTKSIIMPYFEFNIHPKEMGLSSFGATLIMAIENKKLEVAVVTQRSPDNVTLANEAVNSLLPLWLTEIGINMHHIYSLPMGGFRFEWRQQMWSFDQLTELLSSVISGQALPGKYMNPSARKRVCGGIDDVRVDGHSVYNLLRYTIKETDCDLNEMHDMANSALVTFAEMAPKL